MLLIYKRMARTKFNHSAPFEPAAPIANLLANYSVMNQNVWVSLSTSPTRINSIRPFMENLLSQSLAPDYVVLNLPFVFERTGEGYTIPPWLKRQPRILINRCTDYGPITKLLPTLELIGPDDLLITVDDDILYPNAMVNELTNRSNAIVDAVHCAASMQLVDWKDEKHSEDKMKCDLLAGFGGVCYRKQYFPADFQDYVERHIVWPECRYGDDLLISNYLWKNELPIRLLSTKAYRWQMLFRDERILGYGKAEDASKYGASGKGLGTNLDRYKLVIQRLHADGELFFPVYVRRGLLRRKEILFPSAAHDQKLYSSCA